MKIEKLTPELIKKIRMQLGLDQFHFGEILGFADKQVRVSELENGKRKGTPALKRLLEALLFMDHNNLLNDYLKLIGLDIWIICQKCNSRVFDYREITWSDPKGIYIFECKTCGATVEYRE